MRFVKELKEKERAKAEQAARDRDTHLAEYADLIGTAVGAGNADAKCAGKIEKLAALLGFNADAIAQHVAAAAQLLELQPIADALEETAEALEQSRETIAKYRAETKAHVSELRNRFHGRSDVSPGMVDKMEAEIVAWDRERAKGTETHQRAVALAAAEHQRAAWSASRVQELRTATPWLFAAAAQEAMATA